MNQHTKHSRSRKGGRRTQAQKGNKQIASKSWIDGRDRKAKTWLLQSSKKMFLRNSANV